MSDISDRQLDDNARLFIVFEIAEAGGNDVVEEKACQLEQELTFLLARKRHQKQTDMAILDIVAYAGIACQSGAQALDVIMNQEAKAQTKRGELRFPLLLELCQAGRLLTYTDGRNGDQMLDDDVSSQYSRSSDPRIIAEVLKQEKIRTKEKEIAALELLRPRLSAEEFEKRNVVLTRTLLSVMDET